MYYLHYLIIQYIVSFQVSSEFGIAYLHYMYYLHYLIIQYIVSFQVSSEFGIADNVLQKTRAAIAKTVDSLCNEFCPLFHAGWLAYINKTYGAAQPRPDQFVGHKPVVVED